MKQKEQFAGFDKREYNPIIRPKTEQLLKDLLLENNVKNALEIGTYIGYSAAVMLETVEDLHLTTIEKDAENFAYARKNLSAYGSRVKMVLCDALDFLQQEVENLLQKIEKKQDKKLYDLVFLDGPKGQYIKYLPLIKKLLKNGGVLVADDILFYGEVESVPKPKHRAIVKHLRDFLENLQTDKDFSTQIFKFDDGVAVAVKK